MNPVNLPWNTIRQTSPAAVRFAGAYGFSIAPEQSFQDYVMQISPAFLDELAMDRDQLLSDFIAYLKAASEQQAPLSFQRITITDGHSKSGDMEKAVSLYTGEIVCVVGPTGSGKSRLLSDLECLAQGDTPTGRRILLDDAPAPLPLRQGGRFVAELSQHMQFLLDTTVSGFLTLHVRSRLAEESMVDAILEEANRLSGEMFSKDTPLCALSGGQSRALMIADTALLASAPVLLIDELENAGIHREAALSLFLRQKKLVLLSTHDPVLAMLGERRLVMSQGRIAQVLTRTEAETKNLPLLQSVDGVLMELREQLRDGKTLDFDVRTQLLKAIK